MLRPTPVATNVPIVRKRRAPSAPALPVAWARTPHADRWIQSLVIADGGRRVYAGSFAATTGRGLRRKPIARDQAVYALDEMGAVVWRDVCSHFEGVHSVASSRDGNTVAAGGWYSSEPWAGFVSAWTGSGMRLLTWNEAPSRIESVALSADGTTLVAIGEALYLFRRKPGLAFEPKPTAIVELPEGGASGLAMDAAGEWIATTDECGSVYLFERVGSEMAERRYVWRSPTPDAETRIAFSSDGDWLLAASGDGVLHMFNRPTFIATGRPIWTYPAVEAVTATALAITPDGSQIVAAYERGEGGSIYLLGNRDGAPHLTWVKPTKHTPTVVAIDGRGDKEAVWLAAADADPRGTNGNFYLFEVATGMIAGAHSCSAGCWALAFDEAASLLVGGSDDGSIYAFGLPT